MLDGGEGRKERQGIRMRCEEKKRKERNRWRVMNVRGNNTGLEIKH